LFEGFFGLYLYLYFYLYSNDRHSCPDAGSRAQYRPNKTPPATAAPIWGCAG
jgi:hypothetical protein